MGTVRRHREKGTDSDVACSAAVLDWLIGSKHKLEQLDPGIFYGINRIGSTKDHRKVSSCGA